MTPKLAACPATISSIRRITMACTAGSKVRTVPLIIAVPGITLSVVPAWICVTDTTRSCIAWWLRDTMVWIACTIDTAAGIGSAVSCGMAPCPPRPSMWIVNSSTAAMIGPGVVSTRPRSSPGTLCSA